MATVLHSATRLSEEAADGGVDTGDVATSSAAAAAAPTTGLGDMDLQATRALASDITQLGASLYDALNREPALREARSAALARNLDLNEMRAHVTANIADVRAQTAEVRRKLDNLDADERNLEEKIAKKRQVHCFGHDRVCARGTASVCVGMRRMFCHCTRFLLGI